MRLKKIFFTSFFLIQFVVAYAQNVRIGIIQNRSVSSINFKPTSGKYFLIADGKLLDSIDNSSSLEIVATDDSIEIKKSEKKIGTFFQIYLKADSALEKNIFSLKVINQKKTNRKYDGDLEINWQECYLQLINILRMENYISGVVESEAGWRKPREYYKVQAIICRTYALSNLQRHELEDFNLCDQQNCQVYDGMCTDSVIVDAVTATKGLVIVDSNLNLIIAAFHSNCGGETLNSEDVWAMPTSYLKSVVDTFCIHQLDARWKKNISKKSWNNYLSRKRKFFLSSNSDSLNLDSKLCLYFDDDGVEIPTKIIRSDWQLKSAYFSVKNVNDSTVELNGKGFGHRVGLCQEGAMEMTKLGYSYLQVLHFYYTDVTILNRSKIIFFKDY